MLKIDLAHPQIKASGLQSLLLGHSYLGHTQAKVKLGTGEPYQIHIFSVFFQAKCRIAFFLEWLYEVRGSQMEYLTTMVLQNVISIVMTPYM